MRIMGIDPGTNLAFGFAEGADLAVKSFRLAGTEVEKGRAARKWLYKYVAELRPDLVVIEGYAYGNKFSQVSMVSIGALLRDGLMTLELPFIEVAPTSLKKFVVGSGNAKKDQMLLAVYKVWGLECANHDEADAASLAMVGKHLMEPLTDVPKYRQEVLKTLAEQYAGAIDCKAQSLT